MKLEQSLIYYEKGTILQNDSDKEQAFKLFPALQNRDKSLMSLKRVKSKEAKILGDVPFKSRYSLNTVDAHSP